MAGNFKKVGGKFNYVKYAELTPGDVIVEGVYLGDRQGTYGIQHQVKTENGEITVLNSAGHLNYLLENHVTKGDYIQVTYKGTETLNKGKFKGKDMHQFEVGVDDTQRSELPVKTMDSSAAPDESDDEPSEEAEEEAEAEEEQEEEEAAAPAPAPLKQAPARKAEVKAAPAVASAPAAATPAKKTADEVLAKYRNKTAKGA